MYKNLIHQCLREFIESPSTSDFAGKGMGSLELSNKNQIILRINFKTYCNYLNISIKNNRRTETITCLAISELSQNSVQNYT